jgi:glycosyltransferase involved in cell wall biosynthesis
MTEPQVSIIVPAYNYGRYICRALDSLLDQSDVFVEIIVVDDGSTDDTWDLLTRYSSKVKAVRQPNAGVSAARNRGIAEAHGSLIGFLDPDDFCHPNKLSRQISTLRSRRECGWTYCDSIVLDEASGTSRLFSEQYQYGSRLALEGPRLFEALIPSNFISFATPLLRRCCIEEAGAFDERFSGMEDFDFVLRLAATAPAAYCPEPLATYCWHGGSLSKNRARVDRDKYLILDKIALMYPERIRSLGWAARRALADMHNWFAYRHFTLGEYQEAIGRLRASLSLSPLQGRATWAMLRALARRYANRLSSI